MSTKEDNDWIDDVMLKPATWQYDDYEKAKAQIIAKLREVRVDELERIPRTRSKQAYIENRLSALNSLQGEEAGTV